MYSLRVSDAYGTAIHQEFVTITNAGQHLVIRVDGRPNASRSATGGPPSTISVRELEHKAPPKALKAFAKGRDAFAKGRNQEAADFYRQAITADPEYVAAHLELACAQAALGELAESAAQFQKVIEMVPTQRDALVNLPIVLAKMRKYHEAGQVARRTLDLYPDAGKVHFVLAASMLAENGDSAEALDHLQKAAPEVPKAHLVAADVLTNLGRNQDAAGQLEQYLKSLPPNGPDRPAIEARLASMRQ
jgi:tetratricopeptide (TPR) repeat protein